MRKSLIITPGLILILLFFASEGFVVYTRYELEKRSWRVDETLVVHLTSVPAGYPSSSETVIPRIYYRQHSHPSHYWQLYVYDKKAWRGKRHVGGISTYEVNRFAYKTGRDDWVELIPEGTSIQPELSSFKNHTIPHREGQTFEILINLCEDGFEHKIEGETTAVNRTKSLSFKYFDGWDI